ncbi:7TM diverse intracellular signaling domain-containing protein [Algoriphagus namhaensis]|uniref:histidine kinase n=1 Tax=Algoriphagus namhaensis TaxID=915353 RepID=A0ABV8AWB3_9BACT
MFKIALFITSLFVFSQFEIDEKGKQYIDCYEYLITSFDKEVGDVIKSNEFVNNDCSNHNFGIGYQDVWIKLSMAKFMDFDDPLLVLSTSSIDFVDIYSIQNDEIISIKNGGRLETSKIEGIKTHRMLFSFSTKDLTADYMLVKLRNTDKKIFRTYLIEKDEFSSEENLENILFGLISGVFLGLFFYNFFLYLSVKDKIYLVYVLHTALVWMAQASILGYTQFLVWPDWDWMNSRSIVIFSSAVSIVGIWFLRIFLMTKKYVVKLDVGFKIIYGVYTFILINAFLISITLSYQVLLVTQSIVVLYVLFVAASVLRKGFRPARYYLLAWSVFMVGIFLFVFSEMGIIPTNDLTAYIMPFGSALEVVLLSFALADKINILKKEKEEEQIRRLEVLAENENLIREQNTILEKKVKLRTDELENALRNLQETQSQLVNQEKMASLGQLTAGIAHEINNPINFVSSNISPLKRDIADIMEVVDFYRKNANEQFPEALKKEAAQLEEDLELDYVLEEVEQLLKGMDDGAKRTVDIVKGLRLFSRVDEQDVKKVDLHDGINSTIILLNSSMPTKIRIVREFGELPLVECLAGKINQVFMNIINNAIHALSDQIEENKDPKITIRTKATLDSVLVQIEDNGPGMPESVKNKIFEPFFTTKAVGKGTGLGLSIVYSIIENHHGTLEVNSEIGVGTTFSINLPINQSSQKNEE